MKKNYTKPLCEIVKAEPCLLLATSVLPDSGTSPNDILPGEGTFEGEFCSNKESDSEIW